HALRNLRVPCPCANFNTKSESSMLRGVPQVDPIRPVVLGGSRRQRLLHQRNGRILEALHPAPDRRHPLVVGRSGDGRMEFAKMEWRSLPTACPPAAPAL